MTAAQVETSALAGETLCGRHILILGTSSWDASMQRMQHFAHGLADRNRVVFVDPFNPGPYVACKVWLRRLLGKDSPLCHDATRQVSQSLHVYYHRARVLPLRPRFMSEATRRTTEERFLLARLTRYLRAIRFRPEVLCCTHPQHLGFARRLKRHALIYYDVHDNMPAFFPEPERTRLTALDQCLTRSADL
ncbi:MAG: hypothetical protein QHJ73_05670, partial [Armatimonadota bacterium]|nr:hypothetical protein [Armatimonadota bacterium]